ncbi:MAG: tRNA (adenosine(37)-N6)-threonylcarbamoyltransferase complex dimerization subunit type 1 TsaB, partial [Rubrivivax sp.]
MADPSRPPPRALLALDTSTEVLSVALHGPLGLRLHEGEGGAQASATLLPRIQSMLREQGLRAADLQAVAFGCGPGAFTGLRTACAVA